MSSISWEAVETAHPGVVALGLMRRHHDFGDDRLAASSNREVDGQAAAGLPVVAPVDAEKD
ncbi:hypothetical protein [Streptomyces viridochromogenes]|uniref:hypothetical protein n=1 Tax=Streptomyces viridochromogenes TaxID=1938 RepID=UPI00065C813B|nr:hypothetical protein [Streptomyces viridochromogenes]